VFQEMRIALDSARCLWQSRVVFRMFVEKDVFLNENS